ncbi:MAG TPA: SOS response-associated peptidase [Pirellulaceae bacterium]|nr:SOS response-associated peptidase [Pirellulaceae bacterium]HMO90917.1 SOS response-associated peptidase [Pirellulaceae bacterium]HMP68607.1 SOS response-associated peptidase [Pirellulaceae bacterium]
MCGRFTLRTPATAIASMFPLFPQVEFEPRYNIAPGQEILGFQVDSTGAPVAVQFRWGLVPSWTDDPKIGFRMINARAETIADKPSFRNAFLQRRCLILADGFYEWKQIGKAKQPVYIHLADDGPFCFAGLWETNTKCEAPLTSATIITTHANSLLEPLHHRMPVILRDDAYFDWLNPHQRDKDHLLAMLKPFPTEKMDFYTVSSKMNKADYTAPDCIARTKSSMLFD